MKVWPTLKGLRTTAMKTMVLTYSAIMVIRWCGCPGYEPDNLPKWLQISWFTEERLLINWLVATVITVICSTLLRRSDRWVAYIGFFAVFIPLVWAFLFPNY